MRVPVTGGAAYVGVSVREPAKYYHNNVVGTLWRLDAMRPADVRRNVFSSTCATYGIPSKVPIREDHPPAPINPDGFTKLAIERALADFARAYGVDYVALRYFNASGAAAYGTIGKDRDPEMHLIPLVRQVALDQRQSVDGGYSTELCIRAARSECYPTLALAR